MEDIVQQIVPGFTVMALFFVAHIVMMDVSTERERGTLKRLLTGPVTVGQFLAAKVIVALMICVAAMLVLATLSAMLFHTRWGSPVAFIPVSVSMILAILGIMTLVHGLAKTRTQADAASNLIIMGMCFIGGSFFPVEMLPPFIQAVSKWTVNYWAIDGMRAAAAEASASRILQSVGTLSVVGLTALAVGILAMRRRLLKGDNS